MACQRKASITSQELQSEVHIWGISEKNHTSYQVSEPESATHRSPQLELHFCQSSVTFPVLYFFFQHWRSQTSVEKQKRGSRKKAKAEKLRSPPAYPPPMLKVELS